MPFESQAQRAWMYQHDPEMAKRWEAHTPKGRKLPKRKKRRLPGQKPTVNFNPSQPRDNRGRWSAGGVSTLKHGTTARALEKILKEGFSLEEGRAGYYGAGVYFFSDEEKAAKQAKGYGDQVVEAYADIKNPYVHEEHEAFESPGHLPYLGAPNSPLRPELEKRRAAGSTKSWSQLTTEVLQEKGYDSVISWEDGKQIVVVFNPKAITIKGLMTNNQVVVNQQRRSAASRLKADPSQTYTLRKRFETEVKRRFNRFKSAILDLVKREDAFGLTANTRWKFRTNPAKVEEFRKWLQKQAEENLIQSSESTDPNKWWDEYVLEAYRKGQLSSFESINKQKLGESMDFYKGTKEQFLRDSFAQPETKEKIQLLAGRVFTDLKGVTEAMATAMTRTLTDGLSQGQNPFTIARQLVKDVEGIGVNRARMIARTEVIRAHAEGQLDALETMGIEEVGVAVEWDDAGDGRVCRLCSAMDGVVLTVKEAHGLIPRHVNCRCAFLPANVGESKTGQIRGPKGIQGAFDKSIKREIPKGSKRTLAEQKQKTKWSGADTKIVKKRPKSIV